MASNSTLWGHGEGDQCGTRSRGQTTLCRAAPSLREGRDKGNRAPSHKDRHSSVHAIIQNITQVAKGERQRNLKDFQASWAWLFPPFQYMGLSAAALALPE